MQSNQRIFVHKLVNFRFFSAFPEIFAMEVTPKGHCGLSLQATLDFEEAQHYTLQVELDAPVSPEGNEIRKAQVRVPLLPCVLHTVL